MMHRLAESIPGLLTFTKSGSDPAKRSESTPFKKSIPSWNRLSAAGGGIFEEVLKWIKS
jgi:hypothetical protein